MTGSAPEWAEIDVARRLMARADEPREARAVNRYAAAILMPRHLVRENALAVDRTRWPELYGLAARYGVTISALKVRLEELDLLRLGKDGKLYTCRDHAAGQRTMF
jgi:Zn-dependent peptidase ImmA (M78 family)